MLLHQYIKSLAEEGNSKHPYEATTTTVTDMTSTSVFAEYQQTQSIMDTTYCNMHRSIQQIFNVQSFASLRVK
jgi:hypothetical protein